MNCWRMREGNKSVQVFCLIRVYNTQRFAFQLLKAYFEVVKSKMQGATYYVTDEEHKNQVKIEAE